MIVREHLAQERSRSLSEQHRDSNVYPPTGKLVDVGGYQLHQNTQGSGDITLVFDSGNGDSALVWQQVLPELSKQAKEVYP